MVTRSEARADFLRAVERARTGTPIDPKQELQRAVVRAGGGSSVQDSSITQREAQRRKSIQDAIKAREKKASEEKARAELERARKSATAREVVRKETARKTFEQALQRAKAKRSLSSQREARKIFEQDIRSAQAERVSSIRTSKRESIIQKEIIDKTPVNIFSRKSWREFGTALRKSKSQEDRKLGKKILTEPLLFTSQFIRTTLEIEDLPAGLLALIKNPKNIKQIPSSIIEEAKGTVRLLKTSPSEGIGKIGGTIFTFKVIGGSIKVTGRVVTPVATKLSPKFAGVAKTGTSLTVKGAGKAKVIKIKVVGKIPKQPLKAQVELAGKKVTAISTQADRLVGLIRRKKVILKPISAKVKLSKPTKVLLKKFDKGIISPKELIKLDIQIRKAGAKGILERSFFADPRGIFRPSRLGFPKEAKLKDLLSRQATLKKSKPQILLFEDVNIQKLPNRLSSVKNKLINNQPLTKLETEQLLQFQQVQSGKFKPIGFVTRESEITLAPNEIIKRVKKVGVTLVDGKRVPIVSAKIVKPSKSLSNLLKKAQGGKASTKELKTLAKSLTKETGFKHSTSSLKNTKNFIPLSKITSAITISKISKRKPISKISIKKIISKVSSKPSPKRKPSKPKPLAPSRRRPSKPISRKAPSRPSPKRKPSAPSPTRIPSKKKPSLKSLRISEKRRKRKKKKPTVVQGFNVFGKHKGKFIKLNRIPLSKTQALDRGAFAIDRSTGATFKIEGAGKVKKLGKLTKGERGHFSRTRKKYRSFKIQKGRKVSLKNKRIEKRGKARIDTRGEKRGLSLAKLVKQRGFVGKPIKRNPVRITPTRNTPKRKPSPAQLKALAKGRKKLKKLRNK